MFVGVGRQQKLLGTLNQLELHYGPLLLPISQRGNRLLEKTHLNLLRDQFQRLLLFCKCVCGEMNECETIAVTCSIMREAEE